MMHRDLFVLVLLCLVFTAFADTTYVAKGEIPSGIWIKEFSPYIIQDTVRIRNGNCLYIEYGCEILFEDDVVFYVEAQSKLVAGVPRCFGDHVDSVWFRYAGPEGDTITGWDGLRFEGAAACTLDRCHISGVVMDGPTNPGAVSNKSGLLCLTNSLITNNIGGGAGGGGVRVQTIKSTYVMHCTITNNKSYGNGGGIYVDANELCRIDGNFIYNNKLIDGSKDGGGAYLTGSSSFEDDTLLWNKSYHDGGGLFVIGFDSDIIRPVMQFNVTTRRGGAMAISDCAPTVFAADACYNYALVTEGAAVYVFNNANPTFTNCVVAHNDGGGIWCTSSSADEYLKIINCTITNNYSGPGLHIGFTYGSANVILFNSAISYNLRYSHSCQQILMESFSNLYVDHTFIEDTTDICNSGFGTIYLLNPHNFLTGNPVFVDSSECNIGFIPSCSPFVSDLIDAGTPYAFILGDTIWAPEDDFLGNTRFMDANFDLGAFENSCLDVKDKSDLPERTALISAKPNPFNSTVAIEFQIARNSDVEIEAFDMTGRKVASIMNEAIEPGRHEAYWEAGDIPSGVYSIKLRVDREEYFKKVTYLK